MHFQRKRAKYPNPFLIPEAMHSQRTEDTYERHLIDGRGNT